MLLLVTPCDEGTGDNEGSWLRDDDGMGCSSSWSTRVNEVRVEDIFTSATLEAIDTNGRVGGSNA